jgi:hypothetical protein
MSANTGTPASNHQAGGNLRAISGIGEKTARTLAKLGIGSCADLAQYLTQHTADDLAELLAGEGVQASAHRIQNEDWLGQAEYEADLAEAKLAAIEEEAEEAKEAEAIPSHSEDLQEEVRFGVIFKLEKGHWKVTTYDERRNGPEKEWGIEPTEWANWILKQMRPQVEVEPALAKPEADVPCEARVDIHAVRHSEIVRHEKLATEVQFEVSGSNKDAVAADLTPYWVQVQAVDQASKAAFLLASERSHLEPEQFIYEQKLEFPTPEVGRYELQTLVLLLPPVGKMALHQGFELRVEP